MSQAKYRHITLRKSVILASVVYIYKFIGRDQRMHILRKQEIVISDIVVEATFIWIQTMMYQQHKTVQSNMQLQNSFCQVEFVQFHFFD